MKLKISENVIVPNLFSVYQTYDKANNYKPSTVATFGDINNVDALVQDISFEVVESISVLNEADEVVTTLKVNGVNSIDKSVNEEVEVLIRFA